MRLRTKIGALGAAAILTTGIAACGGEAGGGGTTDDPALRLASSTDALAEDSFRVEMTMGELMTATGAFDPTAGMMEMSIDFSDAGMEMQLQVISSETEMWMNMGELGALLGVENGWMYLDLSRLGPDGFMGFEPGAGDPADAKEMLEAVSDLEQVDDRTFEGVIDLTENAPDAFDQETIDLLGEDASSVPFTVTLDDQDRLSTMTITLPDVGADVPGTMEIRYFDYGAAVDITEPPADEVTPMPESAYQMFEQQA